MELPRGLQTQLTQKPKAKVKTEAIKCPVVEKYNKRSSGREPTLIRLEPNPEYRISYNPRISADDIHIYWILSAIQFHGGNITKASKALKISKAGIYRLIHKLNG